MFIESRPVTDYGERPGWAIPFTPQEPTPRPPFRRPPILTANSSASSLSGMEQTIPPTLKQPPFTTADASNAPQSGFEQPVMPFRAFVKRTPPLEESKPLPPTPLRTRRRSSYGDSASAYFREASRSAERSTSRAAGRRTSSVYSRTVSQWLPDSPVWSASDLADNPMPALPPEYLRPIAHSASTPHLVEKVSTPLLLHPRAYQPLLTTPSPTISRRTTPPPPPPPQQTERRLSNLLPSAVATIEIPRNHLRTVSLEKAKAIANAPGAEHMLPEELIAKSKGKILRKLKSLEPIVKSPEQVLPIRKDTLAMCSSSVNSPIKSPQKMPNIPSMTLVDAEGRDRVIGAPRLSVAPLPAFSFPLKDTLSPLSTMNAFPVGKNAPRTMVSMTEQDRQDAAAITFEHERQGHVRGRSIQRGSRNSGYNYYQPNGRRRESSSSARGEENAQQMANEYNSMLAEQYRQASASSASRSINSDAEVGEHMRMVPQPLFHGKPAARQTNRHDSVNSSVSPLFRYEKSNSSQTTQSHNQGHNRFPSSPPPRLSIQTDDRRRSSMGTIPISPPFQYTLSPETTTMPPMPQPRQLRRRNSDDNRVSAYWHIPTKGGNELRFRRSKEKPNQSSPKSPGVPLLAADVVAQRLQTPEATPEPSPLMNSPWPMKDQNHVQPYRYEPPPSPPIAPPTTKEQTAKQALLSRFTKTAVKYADKLTRPTGYTYDDDDDDDEETDPPHPLRQNPPPTHNQEARTSSPHLHSTSTSATAPPRPQPPPPASSSNHKSRPSLGWSTAAKAAFDIHHHHPPPHNRLNHNHQNHQTHNPTPSTNPHYKHTLLPSRPLDERNRNTSLTPSFSFSSSAEHQASDSDGANSNGANSNGANSNGANSNNAAGPRRGSLFSISTLRDLRRETRAEKRREEIKRSIRVVGVPGREEFGGGAGAGTFAGSGSVARGRSAEGRRGDAVVGGGEGDGGAGAARPQLGGGWGRRSISWIGGTPLWGREEGKG